MFYFKDELKGQSAITDFVGLRPKCYAMKIKHLNSRKEDQKKVCKGLKKTSIKNQLSFEEYEKSLNECKLVYKTFTHLKSKNHQINTTFQRKIALSSMDSKKYILPCGRCTLALGSVHIKKYKKHHLRKP